jgi:hypothetical protein
MPRFFFDTNSDQGCDIQDVFGIELPDWEAARKEALKVVSDLARDGIPPTDGYRRDAIANVRDETGRVVFTAHLLSMATWIA